MLWIKGRSKIRDGYVSSTIIIIVKELRANHSNFKDLLALLLYIKNIYSITTTEVLSIE